MAQTQVLTRSTPPASNRHRVAFTVATAIFAAGATGGLFGLGLIIGWFDNEDAGIHRVHVVGFGILFGLILTAAFLNLTRRPETKPSSYFQIVAVAAAALLGGVVSTDANYVPVGIIVVVAAAVVLALHPARGALLRPEARHNLCVSRERRRRVRSRRDRRRSRVHRAVGMGGTRQSNAMS